MRVDEEEMTLQFIMNIERLMMGLPHKVIFYALMTVLSQWVSQEKIPSSKIKGMLDEYISKNLEGKVDVN